MATIVTPTPDPVKRRGIVAAGGVLVALAAAGIGIWQIIDRGNGAGTAPGSSGQASVPAAVRPVEAAPTSDQEMYQERQQRGAWGGPATATAGADRRLTIYLVGSPAQADWVRTALIQRDDFMSMVGQAIPPAEIVVIGSEEEEEARLREGIYESDVHRSTMGLPAATVVDLREAPNAANAGSVSAP